MRDTVFGFGPSMSADQGAPPPPRPPPNSRPRVREVSSRFMSPAPVVSSSTAGDLHLQPLKSPLPKHGISIPTPGPGEYQARQQQLKTTERRHYEKEGLLTCCAHENIPETIRSLDTPLGSRNKALICGPMRKQRALKLFKENGGDSRAEQQQHSDLLQSKTPVSSGSKSSSRPETPTVSGTSCTDRIIPSRFRIPTHNSQHLTNTRKILGSAGATEAAKLLQSSGLSLSSQSPILVNTQNKVHEDSSQEATPSINPLTEPRFVCDHGPNGGNLLVSQSLEKVLPSNDGDSCTASIPIRAGTSIGSPFSIQNSRTRPLPDTWSSMPEGDMLPTLSTRALAAAQASSNCSNRNVSNCQISKLSSASPCSRSLNMPLSSCERSSLVLSFKNGERPSPHQSKSSTSSSSMASLCLPPQPTCMRMGVDSRKGRKPFTSHEQVHSLKLLHNHYLQWRYANAKAEASMHAQRRETESKLYSLGVNIADLRDALTRKRIEVELLRRRIALVTIAEAQMPYLDEWSALEEDYSNSLSESIHALVNSSLRLPVSGNVQVDMKQVAEALHAALKAMEMIGAHVQRFMPKAQEMDTFISELAKVTGGERAVMEECRDLLFKTYKSQVEDCSLRGQLMQLYDSTTPLNYKKSEG